MSGADYRPEFEDLEASHAEHMMKIRAEIERERIAAKDAAQKARDQSEVDKRIAAKDFKEAAQIVRESAGTEYETLNWVYFRGRFPRLFTCFTTTGGYILDPCKPAIAPAAALNKIRKLQELRQSTEFESERNNAQKAIDRICNKHQIREPKFKRLKKG